MTEETKIKIHRSFWLIAILALLWNSLGAANMVWQLMGNALENMPESHQAIIEGRPFWATAGFAVSVVGGALGAVLLLMKKRLAVHVFMAGLVGTVITMIHTVLIGSTKVTFSLGEVFVMIILPLIVSAILVWYAKQVAAKSWLG